MSGYVAVITNDLTHEVENVIGPGDSEDVAEYLGQDFIDHKAKVWDEFQHLSYHIVPVIGLIRAKDDETRKACPEYAENGTCIHSDHTK